jgi:nitrile hydratase
VFALNRAMGFLGKWNIDASRHQRELILAADYLRMSYYEKFLTGLIELMVTKGFVTCDEIDRGHPLRGSVKTSPALKAAMIPSLVAKGSSTSRSVTVKPAFEVGQQVRARNMHPAGHTRLPRYARGKLGKVVQDHGVFVFPDTNAHFLGEKPQHVYSVRFAAQELWGPQASPRDAVYVDLWEDYLEIA